MANPLVYDLRDYQNALNRFRRAEDSYNQRIDEYNKTLAFDTQGRTLVKEKFGDRVYAVTDEGRLEQTGLPEGKTIEDFNFSSLPDSNRYLLMRQGEPLEQKEVTEQNPNLNPYSNPNVFQTRTESVYQERPEAFTQVEPESVKGTVSQIKRLQQGDPMAYARGIIGDVIQSKGVR